MNWDRIEGNWKQFKGRVQSQWGKLTDDDLDVIKGDRDRLAGASPAPCRSATASPRTKPSDKLTRWLSSQH